MSQSAKPFLTDVATLRQRARQHIKDGAVTQAYGGDTALACKVLNEALATEIVCVRNCSTQCERSLSL